MSLTLLARGVLRHFPRLAPRLMKWAPGEQIKPITFAELSKRRTEAGVPGRHPCSCTACRHSRESLER